MEAAIKVCSERHPDHATILEKLRASYFSGEPLLYDNGNVGSDRIKECQDKIQQCKTGKLSDRVYSDWKRRLDTAVTKDNSDKLVDILSSTPHNEHDEKLLYTFRMRAHQAHEKDPNTMERNRHRANNTIDGTPVETLVEQAVHLASTSVYLGRREKPDPVVVAIKDTWNVDKNSITPEEMGRKILAIIETERQAKR